MLKKAAIVALVAAASLPLAAQAEMSNRNVEQIYKECGIGGLIMGNTSPILAIISNITWDWGTTAALSNSMSPATCITPTAKTALFIKESFSIIEKDLAAGQGEHLHTLNSLMDCQAASQNVRRDYARYTTTASYNDANVNQNAEQLFQIVNSNLEAAGCSAS